MKIFLYSMYDKKIGAFRAPVTSAYEQVSDFAEDVRRFVLSSEYQKQLDECDIYYLGVFDDKVGEYVTQKPQFVVSISDLLGSANVDSK